MPSRREHSPATPPWPGTASARGRDRDWPLARRWNRSPQEQTSRGIRHHRNRLDHRLRRARSDRGARMGERDGSNDQKHQQHGAQAIDTRNVQAIENGHSRLVGRRSVSARAEVTMGLGKSSVKTICAARWFRLADEAFAGTNSTSFQGVCLLLAFYSTVGVELPIPAFPLAAPGRRAARRGEGAASCTAPRPAPHLREAERELTT